jgi:hypothetical protein
MACAGSDHRRRRRSGRVSRLSAVVAHPRRCCQAGAGEARALRSSPVATAGAVPVRPVGLAGDDAADIEPLDQGGQRGTAKAGVPGRRSHEAILAYRKRGSTTLMLVRCYCEWACRAAGSEYNWSVPVDRGRHLLAKEKDRCTANGNGFNQR